MKRFLVVALVVSLAFLASLLPRRTVSLIGPSEAQAVPVVALIVLGVTWATFTGATALADCQAAAGGVFGALCIFR